MDFENTLSSFLVQSKVTYGSISSMVLISSRYFFRNKSLNIVRLKNNKKQIFPERRGGQYPQGL